MVSETQQWINLGIFGAVLALFFTWVFDKKGRRFWKRLAIGVIAAGIFLALFYLTAPYVDHFFEEHRHLLDSMVAPGLLGTAVLLLGVGAYVFKQKAKLRYGQVEVLFGVTSAFSVATNMSAGQSSFSHWAALAGAAYVVARGLNNWSEALQQHGNKYRHHSLKQNVLAWLLVREVPDNKEERGLADRSTFE